MIILQHTINNMMLAAGQHQSWFMSDLQNICDGHLWRLSIRGWIAGGAVRRTLMGEPLRDVDIFFRNSDAFNEANRALSAIDHIAKPLPGTPRRSAWLLKHHPDRKPIKLDLVSAQTFPDVETLLSDFDFTCCQFALDLMNCETVYHTPFALAHTLQRRLVVANENKLRLSLAHMERYMREGWSADERALEILLSYGKEARQAVHDAAGYSGIV